MSLTLDTNRPVTKQGFTIRHRDTGLTLRQYAKLYDVQVLGKEMPTDMRHNKLTYLIHEDGAPGFYYQIWSERSTAVYWLSRLIWEIVFK